MTLIQSGLCQKVLSRALIFIVLAISMIIIFLYVTPYINAQVVPKEDYIIGGVSGKKDTSAHEQGIRYDDYDDEMVTTTPLASYYDTSFYAQSTSSGSEMMNSTSAFDEGTENNAEPQSLYLNAGVNTGNENIAEPHPLYFNGEINGGSGSIAVPKLDEKFNEEVNYKKAISGESNARNENLFMPERLDLNGGKNIFSTKPVNDNYGKKIILFSQSRSGSSFIGSILQHIPSTFYSFEPLRFLKFTDTPDDFVDNVLLGSNVSSFLINLLDCNFYHIMNASVKCCPHMNEGRQKWMPIAFPNKFNVNDAIKECSSKLHVVLKIIRVKYLKYIMPSLTDQQVTILDLIRDPRGKLSSMLKLKMEELHIPSESISQVLFEPKVQEFVQTQSKSYCEIMEANYQYLMTLKLFGYDKLSRFVTVRYEDFALYPTKMATKLLSYFGDTPTKEFMDWLHQVTNTELKDEPYIPIRNSTKTAEAWRAFLPFHLVQTIQEQCKNVLIQYGYDLAESQAQLTDWSHDFLGNIADIIPQLL